MKRLAVFLLKVCLSLSLAAVLLAGLIAGYDRVLIARYGAPTDAILRESILTRELCFYPYTGNHVGAHLHHVGPMPWENQTFYSDFDVRTGDHGFFVDFDLENPPAKAPDEFRIILTGGSGAQGWGGRTNDDMLYRRLEAHLNREISPRTKFKYRVVNLAMMGATTLQNYIALNLWGHKLSPDLVISYSGGNDVFVPIFTGHDGYLWYQRVMSFNKLPPLHSSPVAEWLNRRLPGIAAYTPMKELLRVDGGDPAIHAAYRRRRQYAESRDFYGKDVLFEVALPTYVHALQSIKRDFQGVPMIVMFQAIDWRQAYPFIDQEYARFTADTKQRLDGYLNDQWHFIDYHAHWKENDLFEKVVLSYGLHLTNELHEHVAQHMLSDVPPSFWVRPAETPKAARGRVEGAAVADSGS